MSEPARPRFLMIATTGWPILRADASPGGPPRTSYAVVDQVFDREVYADYANQGRTNLPDAVRRCRAEAKADELNRKHAA